MVNNEFHIIGIATSNYEDISNGTFVSHLLKVEVEKFGSKTGKSFELEVQVYGTNRAVNTKIEVLGRMLAINGYLDSYRSKDGNAKLKIVAQNVMLIDKSQTETKRVTGQAGTATVPQIVEEFDEPSQPKYEPYGEDSSDGISLPEDDLPF